MSLRIVLVVGDLLLIVAHLELLLLLEQNLVAQLESLLVIIDEL